MIKQKIIEKLKKTIEYFYIKNNINIELEHPTNPEFGDYATNIALQLAKEIKKLPFQLAKDVAKKFPKEKMIERIEVIEPGFINFWLSKEFLLSELKKIIEGKIVFPQIHFGPAKKIMIEFAQPNTHKLFHIGHLRNISIGESLARVFDILGNKVLRVNYQGDVGLHIAKCLYAIQDQKTKIKNLKTLKDKIEFIGKAYTLGNKLYEEDKKTREEILVVNKMIYEQDPKILSLWQETRQWSLDYFDLIYNRLDTRFDQFYFESQMAKRAIDICQELLNKGILEKSQGAIVFNGKKYGLDTRVFINSLGFPTYEGKELALAEKEFGDFGEIDKCIHVVTPEQTSFFKVTFKVEELLNPKKYQNKQYHLAYEWVKLKSGKMSSREGNIIEANWLIDEAKIKIKERFKSEENIAEALAIAAVKYSLLKNSVKSPIAFDFNESISLEGNSGPYLLYTYVRCQSVLKKNQNKKIKIQDFASIESKMELEEVLILKLLTRFPEVVEQAAKNLAPNYIANYLYDLAQKFNLFYQKYSILKTPEPTRSLRLAITKATGLIIKKGLYLLGIKTVEKM